MKYFTLKILGKHFTFAQSFTPRYLSLPHFVAKTIPLVYLSKKIQPLSQISLQKSQPPPVPSPTNLWLQGPRHHRPATASAGAAHRRQNQVLFCPFRLDFSFFFSFFFISNPWFFLGSICCFIIIYLCVSYGFVSFWLLCSLLVTGFLVFDF